MVDFEKSLKSKAYENYEINNFYWLNRLFENEYDENTCSMFKNKKSFESYKALMNKKIQNDAFYYDKTETEIVNSILSCETYRNKFAKDAKRQKTHELTQVDVMNKVRLQLDGINECKLQFVDNENEERFLIKSDGSITQRIGKADVENESKLIDYIFYVTKRAKTYKIYFINKYTKENGGSQNDIYREIKSTCNYAKNNKDENAYFYFILDGAYWEDKMDGDACDKIIISNINELNKNITELLNKF